MGRILFKRVWPFLSLLALKFLREKSVRSFQLITCVSKRTHPLLCFAELSEFGAELSEFLFPTSTLETIVE